MHTNSHPGQEFNYVLEGNLRFIIRDQAFILNEGDSVDSSNSSCDHAMVALNSKTARVPGYNHVRKTKCPYYISSWIRLNSIHMRISGIISR